MMRRMPTVALVPVRSLADGKQRLAAVLSDRERCALVRAMLEDVLDALARAAGIAASLVVSGDTAVLPVAEATGAILLPDVPEGGLNASLQAASAWVAAALPGHALLVVAGDLPVLTPALVESVVPAAKAEIVIARSLDGGTNLLWQAPPLSLRFAFGAQSCTRHRTAARAAGRTVAVLEHPVLARDLDTPDDLAALLPLLRAGQTMRLLQRLRPADRALAGRQLSGTRGR